jgi:TonB family protein
MEVTVSDILRTRMQGPGGVSATSALSVSLVAHAVALTVLSLVPSILPKKDSPPKVVMSISLGGSPGPKTGGQMMIGGRSIQAARPTTDPKLEKPTLPSLRPPSTAMVLPDPKQKPRTPPKNTATSNDPKGTNVGRGFETRTGSTQVDTGAKGMGFGLSSGGGGGDGIKLDVQNFCCPEYLQDMIGRLYRNWTPNQGSTGVVVMKYTIQRDGTITDIQVEESANNPLLDRASQLALTSTRRLGALPSAFPDDHLTIHLWFKYERRQ